MKPRNLFGNLLAQLPDQELDIGGGLTHKYIAQAKHFEAIADKDRIIEGLKDKMNFEQLEAQLVTAPMTWIPALFITLVKTGYNKKVFQPGGASHLATKVEGQL